MEKHLASETAINKYRELAESIQICMFISSPENNQSARPMATTKVDEDGTTWFFTRESSGKVQEVNQEETVHLVYAHPGKSSYMDVWGTASTVTDRDKIKELWNPMVKAWFPQGIDDPDLCLLRVVPQNAHYWDTETGKMIQFMSILASAVTGKKFSEGVEGSLNL